MAERCQVFISSTYMDLKEERQEIARIVLKEGHFPVGMEWFKQEDKKQWEVIQDWIQESDFFIIMVKNRYGTICDDTGKSYTEMEYDYAVELGKPIIRIVFNDDIDEGECDDIEAMKAFRAKLRKNNITPPIRTDVEMAYAVTSKLKEYADKAIKKIKAEDIEKLVYYYKRYKLM